MHELLQMFPSRTAGFSEHGISCALNLPKQVNARFH